MNNLTLQSDNQRAVADRLTHGTSVIACLCAAWCDTCTAYQIKFNQLASLHPEQFFVWIDIENQADIVGDLNIDNFPTLLIQQGDIVSFFGMVQPDLHQADRLVRAQLEMSRIELEAQANSSEERQKWQRECNLLTRLDDS